MKRSRHPVSAGKQVRDVAQNLIDRFRGGRRSELRRRLSDIHQLIGAEQWEPAVRQAKDAAEVARAAGHLGMLSAIGRLLEQLGEFEASAPIRFAGERRSYRPGARLWMGEDLSDKTLLIEQVFQHLGQQLRHVRLIAPASQSAKRCIVLAEPRLMPLLKRTFAGADVRDQSTDYAAALAEADLVTNSWDLAQRFAGTRSKIEAGFVPLRPNNAQTHELQSKYHSRSPGPLIGISWGTSNQDREVANLADWAGLLSSVPATYVSLQYGVVDPAIQELDRFSAAPIINDSTVDQLIDMDRFCAQIASLDLVVTIDNTVAHAAGALGKPAIVITNDGPSHWPLQENRTPWYPSVTVLRRRGRSWNEVFDEAAAMLSAQINGR